MKQRILSILLTVCLIAGMLPQTAFANEGAAIGTSGLCEHHTAHDETCGYVEGTAGTPCAHEHGDKCYTEVTSCTHEHTEDCYPVLDSSVSGNEATPSDAEPVEDATPSDAAEPTECVHVCSEDSGCIVQELNCTHEHDSECGYVPAVEGHPCGYDCELCGLTEITAWSWVDELEAIDPESGVLALPGASAESPALYDEIVALLPAEITATTEDGTETIALDGWACPGYPEAGAYTGSYAFSASLPEGYRLAEGVSALRVTVELGGAEVLETDGLTVAIDTSSEITLYDTDSDGYYEIGTADELYAFAAAVNGDNTSINGKLTKDIVVNENLMDKITIADDGTATVNDGETLRVWTPIGYYENDADAAGYLGKFDGAGYTISGLYINDDNAQYASLFGVIDWEGEGEAEVRNVGIIDSYFYGSTDVGGVAGWCGACTFINCYCIDTVITTCSNVGVAGGVVASINAGSVTNCYHVGTVNYSGNSDSAILYLGGVVGNNSGAEVTNCYHIGTVTEPTDEYELSSVGGVVGNNLGTVTNCYYQKGDASSGIGGEDEAGAAEAKTAEQFASGEVAYLLGSAWGQTCGTGTPVLGGTTVYKNQTGGCTEESYTYEYSNEEKDAVVTHSTDAEGDVIATCKSAGHCTRCDQEVPVDPTNHTMSTFTYTADADGTTHTKRYDCCSAVAVANEAHTITYTAEDSTMKAICGDCKSEGTATIKAAGGTYNGTVYTATVSGTGILENKTWNITYAVKDGAALSDAPSDVGQYTASITKDGKTASVSYEIKKAAATLTTAPTANTLTYTGDAQALVSGGSALGGKLVYSLTENGTYTENVPTATDAGDHTVYCKVAGDDNHEDSKVEQVKVTIKQADSSVTKAPQAVSGLTYDGSALTLVTAGEAHGGEIQYSLDEATWSKDIPSGTDAGTYTVYYKVVGDSNHKDSAVGSVAVTIAPKVVSSPVIEGIDAWYLHTGSAITPIPTAVKDGDTVIDPKEYNVEFENNTGVGTATVKITDNEGGNYTVSGSKTFEIVVHAHDWKYTVDGDKITATCFGEIGTCPTETVTITLTAPTSLTYDGSGKTVTVTQSPAGVFTDVPATVTGDWIKAGQHTAELTYGGVTAKLDFTIEKATIKSVSVDVTAPEAGAAPQASVTTGTGYSAEIKWNEAVETFGYNTAYTATVTLTVDDNHKFGKDITVDGWDIGEETEGVLTLTRTFDATRKAKLQSITNAPTDVTLTGYHTDAAGAIAELPKTVTYATESGNATVAVAWNCENYNSATKAANTFSWAVKAGELENYDANSIMTSGSITVTNVDALPVTNSGSDAAITYSGTTYDVSTMFTLDKNAGAATYSIVSGGTGAGTLDGKLLTITKAGTITIKVTTAAKDPYAAGEATATLTVHKAAGSGSVSIEGWTYGEAAKAPTTSDGKGAAAFSYNTTDGKVPTNAGTYTVTATFAATDLYEEATATDTFTIGKKTIAVTADAKSKTYGDNDPSLTYTTEGLVGSDTLYGSLSRAEGENVGTYAITVGTLANDNYTINFTGANLTVNPKSITVTADAVSKTYGEGDPKLTYTAEGLVNGDQLTGGLKRVAGENVGTYAIEQGTLANRNYIISFTGAKLTINKATPTVTVTANPASSIAGKTISVSAAVKNPYNNTLTDLPMPAYTYKIGDGAETAITGSSFVIPAGTPIGTIITIKAATNEESNYLAGSGTATVTVTACQHTGSKTLGHDDSSHWYVCDDCGAELDKAAHTGGTATCTGKAVCGTCRQAYGNSLGHDFTGEAWENDADNHWKKCSRCDAFDEKIAHNWNDGAVTKQPTCTAEGQKTFTCTDCGRTKQQSLDALGHDPIPHEAKAATCTEKGWSAYDTCSRCNHTTYAEIAALGHDFTVQQYDATQHWRKCSRCDVTDTKENHSGGTATCKDKAVCSTCSQPYGELDANNHTGGTEVRGRVEATTSAAGYTGDTYCKGCNTKIKVGTTIPKLDNIPGGQDNTSDATSPKTGDQTRNVLWISLLGISAVGIVALLLLNRKRRTTK